MTYLEMAFETFLDTLAKALAAAIVIFMALVIYYAATGTNLVGAVLGKC